MNEAQQIYCDGAAMAYRDVARKIKQMILDAPPEVKGMMSAMEPFADSCLLKADEVYKEAERHQIATRQ